MEIQINNEQEKFSILDYENKLKQAFALAAKFEGLKGDLEVSISFVDNQEIRKLNHAYRQIDAATDVLSFPQEDDFPFMEGLPRLLGDIVISLEQAQLQSEEYGHSLTREVLYLVIHGFYHLLGYDHETEQETREMRAKEEKVLSELDVGRE